MGEWFDDLPAPMSVDRAVRTDTPGIGRANAGGKAPPRPERGKVYSSDSGSYWSDAGKVAKGYFWEGPKALVTGLYHVATTDPRVTAQNLADGAGTLAGNLVYNTSDTLSSIGNAFVDPNTAGQAWFNAALVGVPVARAAHARFGASARTAVAAETATGAFNPASRVVGDGLGKLAGRSVRVSERGINLVERHLAQFGDDAGNSAMIGRLRSAFAEGRKISGADASFYLHEASEATMMGRGMLYNAAHDASLLKYGVSPYSVYAPEVILANPGSFNNAFRSFWGLK